MNRLITKISLGLGIYLASSLLYDSVSLAVSLGFSDRYNSITLDEQLFFYQDFLSIPTNINSEFEIRQEITNSPYLTESNKLELLRNLVEEESNDLTLTSQVNIQLQTDIVESEDVNLLEYLANSLGSLELNSFNDASAANVEVAILPQVAYEDIYSGLYDYDINLNNSISSVVVDNLRRDNSSVAREIIPRNVATSLNSLSFVVNDFSRYDSSPDTYSSNSSSEDYTDTTDSEYNSNYAPNTSAVLGTVIPQNTNIYTSNEEIEIQSNYNFSTELDKFQTQKDPQLKELDKTLEEQRRLRERERLILERKLKQEQQRREAQREMQEKSLQRERERNLKIRQREQRKAFQEQQRSL